MTDGKIVKPEDCATWPRWLRHLLDTIACVFMQAYQLTRVRAAGSPSNAIRLMAERDEALWRIALLERELAIFRRRIGALDTRKRPPLPA